jgi:hypothetical protein
MKGATLDGHLLDRILDEYMIHDIRLLIMYKCAKLVSSITSRGHMLPDICILHKLRIVFNIRTEYQVSLCCALC